MITHKQIKFIHSLKLKKNRIDFFVVEGEKMLEELIRSTFQVELIYHTPELILNHPKAIQVSLQMVPLGS